ncbi:MAG: FAD binding domain-containing protein [Burkholderiales bacterium]|nr:FAD binding domain-containing protein [Burkholderiales bacterium]
MPSYLRPTSLPEAVAALAQGSLTVLAGGTDYYPSRVGKPLTDDILDISAIAGLRGIRDDGAHWRIGATTSWSELIAAELPPLFDGLKLAAREIGGVQIQNAGTIAGNLCNASPAADGVPALLALDARVEIADIAGSASLALDEFILGNRRTVLRPDQLLSAILIPKPAHPARSHFAKLGARKYLVVSIVMAAATLELESGRVCAARVALGAASEMAQRLPLLEAALIGRRCAAQLGEHAKAEHLAALTPIDDVRASREYRLDAGLVLVRRVLNELGARA